MDLGCRPASDSKCNRRGLKVPGILVIALIVSGVPKAALAAGGGGGGGASDSVVLTTEALEESNQDTHPVSGRTSGELSRGKLSISDFVLLSGPALNNL